MLQGSRKSCRNSFEFSRPLLKNTKVCCARPKKRWRGWVQGLMRLMHCCERCWNSRKIEVGLDALHVHNAYALSSATLLEQQTFSIATLRTMFLCLWTMLSELCMNLCVVVEQFELVWWNDGTRNFGVALACKHLLYFQLQCVYDGLPQFCMTYEFWWLWWMMPTDTILWMMDSEMYVYICVYMTCNGDLCCSHHWMQGHFMTIC